MSNWKLLRAILLPRNIALAAVPIAVNAKEESQKGKTALRPSELPIYTEELIKKATPETSNDDVSAFEELVGTVRKEFCSLASEVNSLSNKASAVVKENLEASNEILDFLKEEDNVLPRAGAIALGGLTGFVFGLRGGFFKRLIYMSFGAGGVAALCYPKEAEEYFNEGMVEVRKYGLIGHHLATSSFNFLEDESTDEKWLYEDEYIESELDSPNSIFHDLEEGTAELVVEHKHTSALGHPIKCSEPMPTLEHNHPLI